ncbi:MAG: hypothetical protein IKT07_02635 [Oscillospiraceae bacterium]|nr:hypothetical protein [Oscillospiraceae bacterium]
MKLREVGFRALYRHFCAFPVTAAVKQALAGFPEEWRANIALVYGYIDREAGLTLEIIAAGEKNDLGFRFFDTNPNTRSFLRISAVAEEEFSYFDDPDGEMRARFAEKLTALGEYDASEDVERTRGMKFLDPCRDFQYVDDVVVYLKKNKRIPEGVWARITGYGEFWFTGTLLNEPTQPFGVHKGDSVAFTVQEEEDKTVNCIVDLDPGKKIRV